MNYISLFVSLAIVIIGVSVFVFFLLRNKKYKRFILEKSEALKIQSNINAAFCFYDVEQINLSHNYDNENFYNDISCLDFLIYFLRDYEKFTKKQIETAHQNARLYTQYMERMKREAYPSLSSFHLDGERLSVKKLNKVEKKEFESRMKNPITSTSATVLLRRVDLHEKRTYETKKAVFDQGTIISCLEKLDNKKKGFYQDSEIWDALCRVERGKVTNKLRFYIYHRDGNRCVRCGCRKNLEVDHIYPISKGGKTTPNNLQTLCHRCNVEKGARTDY